MSTTLLCKSSLFHVENIINTKLRELDEKLAEAYVSSDYEQQVRFLNAKWRLEHWKNDVRNMLDYNYTI